jgi:radical SAM protein with 4Fe4S-binding SPASM domain
MQAAVLQAGASGKGRSQVPVTDPPLPAEVQLEVTGACNLACRMCLVRYRPKLGKAQGAMSFERFREIVDALPDLRRLTLQGLGEPLLAPRIVDMVAYAAGRGVEVGFNTNGMLLTPARARALIEAGLGWLHVSLDGASAATYESIRSGARFDQVARHVQAAVAERSRRGAETPRMTLVTVAMRRNVAELPDVVRLAAEWGVGRLWVQNLSHSFSDTDPFGEYAAIRRFAAGEALFVDDDAAAQEAFARARATADALGVELRLPRLEEPSPEEPSGRGCDWPHRSAYVTHEGAVQPCCMVMGSDRATLGRLDDGEGFAGIWRGAAYRRFRAQLAGDDPPEVCQGCSLYRRVF